MSFYINGREWTGRTNIFACTTTNACVFVDSGDARTWLVIGIRKYHLDGAGWTVTSTVATTYTIGKRYAIFLDPYGMSNLNTSLFFLVDRTNSTSRTYSGTTGALRTTMASLITHYWLHQMYQISWRTKHFIGTFRNAQLTTGTAQSHVLCRKRTRRG